MTTEQPTAEMAVPAAEPMTAIVMAGPDAVLGDPHPVYDALLAEQPDDVRATVDEAMSRMARSQLKFAEPDTPAA